jgi:outer membrane protein assembly factor BamD
MLYQKKGSVLAAANRFSGLTTQFPLYSKADEGLWQLAAAYHRAGDKFEDKQVEAYQKIVKDYPLSIHAEDARAQLEVMKRTVPEADPVALAHMKYELENRTKRGPVKKALGGFSGSPDITPAAKSGTPPMEGFRPTVPSSIPVVANSPTLSNDVTISNPSDTTNVDKAPDVRAPGAPGAGAGATLAAGAAAATTAPPTEAATKTQDPNAVVQQATMTPAQQKKAFAAAVKQQQDAARKFSTERKKREAQQAQLVKEQKKKTKQKQQDQEKQDKDKAPTTPPAATGPGAQTPAKQ